jgi:DNA-binding LytR/AlgR family response regulator
MSAIRILIVEDDPIIGADLQDRLEEIGYAVLGPVASGEEALTFFPENSPDVVIMDVQLEGEWDGIETTRRIREICVLPVIFLTSNSDEATFAQAKSVQPQAFIAKPFRGKDLRHAIELAIAQSVNTALAASEEAAAETTFLLPDRMFVKVNEKMVRLFFRDILWVEAYDYYCKIVTREREYLVGQTLKKFSESLKNVPALMRVHRSYVVNLDHVEEISDAHLLVGKQRIPVNKTSKDELIARLQKV